MRGGLYFLLGVFALAAWPAAAQEAKQVEKSGEWSVYVHQASANAKICFAVTQPKTQKPEGIKRGQAYFYVSHWTQDKVKEEVSAKLGYPLKAGAPVEVKIGTDKFTLFSKAQGAWVDKKDVENKLVESMKKGGTMVVQARSDKGTLTTDEYSLAGLGSALERVAKECP